MKTLVLVFTGVMLAFQCCQCDWTEVQAVLNLHEVQSKYIWCGMISTQLLRQTGRWGLLCITLCPCTRATVKKQGTYVAMHKYYHNNVFANKKNHDAQIHKWGESVVLSWFHSITKVYERGHQSVVECLVKVWKALPENNCRIFKFPYHD
jgi:hypothetical protein